MLRRWENSIEGTLQNSSVTLEDGEPNFLNLKQPQPAFEFERAGVTKAGETTVY